MSAKQGTAAHKRTVLNKRLKKINWKGVIVALTVTGLVWLSWSYISSHTNQAKLQRTLETKQAELDKKLQELNHTKLNAQQLEQAKKDLEAQKADLERQLQAKKNVVYAAVAPIAPTVRGNCAEWISAAGIKDVNSAVTLINKESGCNPNAVNRSSGACGVAQELPCGKSGCSLGDGACQVRWMNSYVTQRYGSWANALAFHRSHNWY